MAVIDSVPAACRGVRTVAPVKPPTQSRKVASKGKAVSHPTTRPHAHKVTRIVTPMPEVTDVAAPLPPVTGPSRASCAPIFEVADGSGDKQVEKGALHPLASAPWVSHGDSLIVATPVFGTPILLKHKADNI